MDTFNTNRKNLFGDEGEYLGSSCDASQEDANYVLAQPVDLDGRSDWKWVRLTDGSLILGVYPCGDTYIEMSDKINI